jgi:hypothetical protein
MNLSPYNTLSFSNIYYIPGSTGLTGWFPVGFVLAPIAQRLQLYARCLHASLIDWERSRRASQTHILDVPTKALDPSLRNTFA